MKLVGKIIICLVIVVALILSSQTISAEEKKDTDFRMYWKEGIRFETGDKAFKIQIGGRIMNDWAFMSGDDSVKAAVGDLQDATTEFRRARFYIAGTIYDKIIFKAQYDFAGGDADFKAVYLGLKKLPGVGKLIIGHFKEPIGLENLTSSKYITLMERALITAFLPSYNTGIGVFKTELDERLTWAVGAFLDTNAYGDEDGAESNFAATARITGIPWYEGKDRLLHLGLSYSYRDAKDDSVSFSERPETHLAPQFVDTGSFGADSENRFGIETALVYGPLSVQGEYMVAKVDALSGSDPEFLGYYAYISYFLTGEHRAYKKSAGAFSRVKPKANFGKGGIGAWELALRYSALDLNDEAIVGGELEDITFGVNWYLNPNVRVMGNYVRADLDDVGDADIFQTRFQIDF
jgi:phosphate-selective porin OprO/OprP